MASEIHHSCRLCGVELACSSKVLEMSPFPRAAQYYPEPADFSSDTGIKLEIHQCPACALVQLSNEPVEYFREVITAASLSPNARSSRLNEFKNFVEKFSLEGKSCIEVGCGKGGMLEVIADAGLEAIGIEYSIDSVEYGRMNGRKILHGYINNLGDEHDGLYDSFVSLNYIEHQPNTANFIRALYRITSSEAVGYVTAPNLSYLLKSETLYEFVADHLVYFTEETMRRAFEVNGFEVLDSKIINNQNDIALTVRKRALNALAGKETTENLIRELQYFFEELKKLKKRLAVWGAGHRTLALLALANAAEHIEFIVDSADFKQGKYSPITHIPIVSPMDLAESDIDAVIVAVPGIYPDEVISSIKSLAKPFDIYKLMDNKLMKVA